MSISDVLKVLLGKGVSTEQAVDIALTLENPNPVALPAAPVVQTTSIATSGMQRLADETMAAKRKRRYRGRKFYFVTDAALQAASGVGPAVKAVQTLIPSWGETLKAVHTCNVKGTLCTAKTVETMAGQKMKTVESSLHNLRHLGLVVSVMRDDQTSVAAHMARFTAAVESGKRKRKVARKVARKYGKSGKGK